MQTNNALLPQAMTYLYALFMPPPCTATCRLLLRAIGRLICPNAVLIRSIFGVSRYRLSRSGEVLRVVTIHENRHQTEEVAVE